MDERITENKRHYTHRGRPSLYEERYGEHASQMRHDFYDYSKTQRTNATYVYYRDAYTIYIKLIEEGEIQEETVNQWKEEKGKRSGLLSIFDQIGRMLTQDSISEARCKEEMRKAISSLLDGEKISAIRQRLSDIRSEIREYRKIGEESLMSMIMDYLAEKNPNMSTVEKVYSSIMIYNSLTGRE